MAVRTQFLILASAIGVLLQGCSGPAAPIELRFAVHYGDTTIGCTEPAREAVLTDLRFYAYGFALAGADGSPAPVALDDDGIWQNTRLALLDLEDGEGGCLNGTAVVNRSVRGSVRGGPFEALEFVVGVPADLNHANPLTARPPLADSAMHWHWRSGYKFLRAGLRTPDDGFWMHLGSNRCAGTAGDISGCAAPNRVQVRLDHFDPARDLIVIDLAQLFAGVDFEDGAAGDCSSGAADRACREPFHALGLDFESGEAGYPVTIFRTAPAP